MKKHIANILTICRAVISLYLLSFEDVSGKFLKWFTAAGVTDLLDGPIARITDSVSLNGSRLDTLSDVLLYVSVVKLIIRKRILKKSHYILFAVGVLGLAVSAVIGVIKFGKLFFIHTLVAKVLGVGCFCLPFSLFFGSLETAVIIVCVLLILLASESIFIQIRSKHPAPDALTVFSKSVSDSA